jgi:hypothetical protein
MSMLHFGSEFWGVGPDKNNVYMHTLTIYMCRLDFKTQKSLAYTYVTCKHEYGSYRRIQIHTYLYKYIATTSRHIIYPRMIRLDHIWTYHSPTKDTQTIHVDENRSAEHPCHVPSDKTSATCPATRCQSRAQRHDASHVPSDKGNPSS